MIRCDCKVRKSSSKNYPNVPRDQPAGLIQTRGRSFIRWFARCHSTGLEMSCSSGSDENWSRLTASLIRLPDNMSSWRSWCGSSSSVVTSIFLRFHEDLKGSHSWSLDPGGLYGLARLVRKLRLRRRTQRPLRREPLPMFALFVLTPVPPASPLRRDIELLLWSCSASPILDTRASTSLESTVTDCSKKI